VHIDIINIYIYVQIKCIGGKRDVRRDSIRISHGRARKKKLLKIERDPSMQQNQFQREKAMMSRPPFNSIYKHEFMYLNYS